MNTDADNAMSIEEQFLAFNGRVDPAGELPWPAPAPEQAPPPLVAVPAVEVVAPEQSLVVPDPPPVVAQAVPVVAAPAALAEDEQADSLLADLDKATKSLVSFRDEIGRVVQLQRTTAAELGESRRQFALLAEQQRECADCGRLQSELAQQRSLVASVRAKLGEVIQTLDLR
jgi:hypothetical protein